MASELQWQTVAVEELSSDIQTLYTISKERYKEYKVARDNFENAMQEAFAGNLGANTELKFGYNFGKLSVAIGPKVVRKEKPKVRGLAEWLAAQAASGCQS